MEKLELGELKRIENLREVWSNEEYDFTPWLAEDENIKLLGKTIGIENIKVQKRETNVGDFKADIYAIDEDTANGIIIENQVEQTDHDHLGKCLTYASGLDASVIIWIVKKARDEHRKAMEWLNDHTDEDISFFLLEIELWQIDNSRIAPSFNVIVKPNGWAREMKKQTTKAKNPKMSFLKMGLKNGDIIVLKDTNLPSEISVTVANVENNKVRMDGKTEETTLSAITQEIYGYAVQPKLKPWFLSNGEKLSERYKATHLDTENDDNNDV